MRAAKKPYQKRNAEQAVEEEKKNGGGGGSGKGEVLNGIRLLLKTWVCVCEVEESCVWSPLWGLFAFLLCDRLTRQRCRLICYWLIYLCVSESVAEVGGSMVLNTLNYVLFC